ncbi:MAG: MarR family winged helix-turn-helix transcriptional regulator [Gammaproteobacteria bacterium]
MNSEQAFNLAIRTRKMRELYMGYAKTYGITFNELEILRIISIKKNITSTEISRSLHMEPAIVSRKIKILNNNNLLKCIYNKVDKRVINLQVTANGSRILKSIFNKIEKG